MNGQIFYNATQVTSSRKNQKIISSQPGYKRGEKMSVWNAIGDPIGSVRLYVYINGNWCDASLKPIFLKVTQKG